MKYAPVIIPTLCRSRHFTRLVESLGRNAWACHTELYIGLDYPPSERYRQGWEEIGRYLAEADLTAFKAVHVWRRERNVGAVANSRLLHEEVARRHDRWIYTDDDIEVSPSFLEYIDRCLEHYENDPDVVCVCGYSYPIAWDVSAGATCLKQGVNCSTWGTGYWRDKSEPMRAFLRGGGLARELPAVIGEKRYLRMIDPCLREYMEAALSPWLRRRLQANSSSDIGHRCYLAATGHHAVSPVVSKTRNHGFDGSGLNCDAVNAGGTTALTYDYSRQPIDTSPTFALVEDTLHSDTENHRRLNAFDCRTAKEMRHTRRLLWLCEHVGRKAALALSLAHFLTILPGKIWRKARRRL